jgi:hypothetical protein
MGPDPTGLVSAILNDAWMVRHYARGFHKLKRRQAILKLGLTVREAFNSCDDYEVLLAAVVDGLRPHDRSPF